MWLIYTYIYVCVCARKNHKIALIKSAHPLSPQRTYEIAFCMAYV
jgi:hypothetical protein